MTDQRAQTTTTPSSPPRFYVPAVHIPAEAAKAGPVHKIHILGDDARSRFIAHALAGVYNSVELLGMRSMPKSRYRNVQKASSDRTRGATTPERNNALRVKDAKDDNQPFDELVVTGRGYEAVEAVKAVKHRVDEKTSICLMNDGMGVLEDIREEVFKGTDTQPNFTLGHMSHSLAYNRNSNSVKELRGGKTLLTHVPSLGKEEGLELSPGTITLQKRPSVLETMQQLGRLRVTQTTYDEWLRFKLPSMIFTAVVEPVCVLLDLSYKGFADNKAARTMLHQFLEEIIVVAENLPEVQESAEILAYLRGPAIQRLCFNKLKSKAAAPSDLLRRVNNGWETDINYQNGYFLRRAKKMGIDMPMNSFMAQMVEAKREQVLAQREAYIPVVERSHADQAYKQIRQGFEM